MSSVAARTLPALSKKVIFSGIQPTGVPHLGNYLGALQQWVHLQNTAKPEDKLIYSLVDLHAITVQQQRGDMERWTRESLAILLAIGLDPERSIIYRQSQVSNHTEVMWMLSCHASMGQLSRMTQWKSKLALPDNAKPSESPLQLGLFAYPVLQAADILIHDTTHVPVGEDQSQHLEFTRDLANGVNAAHNEIIFTRPETIISPAKRIMSLANPSKKMSKSDINRNSRILLSDSREVIAAKVKAAVTDSHDGVTYDPIKRPEIANLIDIMYHIRNDSSTSEEQLAADCTSKAALKDKLTATIEEHISPIREKFLELITPEKRKYLQEVSDQGTIRAKESASPVTSRIRAALGFEHPFSEAGHNSAS